MEFTGASYGAYYQDDSLGMHQDDAAGAIVSTTALDEGHLPFSAITNSPFAGNYPFAGAAPILANTDYPNRLLDTNANFQAQSWSWPSLSSQNNLYCPLQGVNHSAAPENLIGPTSYPGTGFGDLAAPGIGDLSGGQPAVLIRHHQHSHFEPQTGHNEHGIDTAPYPYGPITFPDYSINTYSPPDLRLEPSNPYTVIGQDGFPAGSSNSLSIPGSYGLPMTMASGVWYNDDEAGTHCQLPIAASLPNVGNHRSKQGHVDCPMEQAKVQYDDGAKYNDSVSYDGPSAPNDDQAREAPSTEGSRVACDSCNKTFKRRSDMMRHAQKHSSFKLKHQCGVKDCGYEGHYRVDKVYSHINNCHLKGNDSLGVIRVGELGMIVYCFPASGDCLLSQKFLGSDAFANGEVQWVTRKRLVFFKWAFLSSILSEDGMGLKRLTEFDLKKAHEQCYAFYRTEQA